MSSNQSHNSSHQSPHFDESKWVIQIRQTLEEEIEDDTGVPVSVLNIPKPLRVLKPEAYMPQFIALRPYHHWRPKLYEMERYKLASARRIQKNFHGVKLQHLVEQFMKLEHKIRAYYHRYLDFNGETLAWMMIVDALFLLEFLQIHSIDEEGKPLRRLSSRMSHLVDFAGRKSAHNMILRDSMMLENQIPLYLLKRILDPQCTSSEHADNLLCNMLTGYMKELCPLKLMENFPEIGPIHCHSHLLELLYFILVPRSDDPFNDQNDDIEEQNDNEEDASDEKKGNCDYIKQLFSAVGSSISLNGAPIRYIKRVIISKQIQFLIKEPWKVLTSLPGFSVLKQPIENLLSSQMEEGSKKEDGSSNNTNKPPLIEEIMIPSVEELVDVGVKFSPTNGDLTTISFDLKTIMFYLPTISLDLNTEVILRNLVAYEASAASGPLVFTRYTELMNGIIDHY